MSFHLNIHRETKWPHNLIVDMQNPEGGNFHEEFQRMAAQLLSIPGAEMSIKIPVEPQATKNAPKAIVFSPPLARGNDFAIDVNVLNQGYHGTVAIIEMKGRLVEPQDTKILRNTMQYVKSDAVLFDLSGVQRINDDGLGQFMSEWKGAADNGRTVMVSGPFTNSVQNQLTITKLNKTIGAFPDQKSALEWYQNSVPAKAVGDTTQLRDHLQL